MTESIFRHHGNLRAELRALLDNPTMQTALRIVEDRAKPRITPEPRPNAHLDTLIAQEYKLKQGIQWAVDTLERLTHQPDIENDNQQDEEEFFDSLPDVMKQAILENRK